MTEDFELLNKIVLSVEGIKLPHSCINEGKSKTPQ